MKSAKSHRLQMPRDDIPTVYGRLFQAGEIYSVSNRDSRIPPIKALALHRVMVVNCCYCRGEHAVNLYDEEFPQLKKAPCRRGRVYMVQPYKFDISDGGEYTTNETE